MLHWSTSKLNRIELGQLPDMHGLKSRLDLYGVTGDRWEEYFQLLADAEQPGWWRAYGVDDKGYVPLEADVLLVRDYTLAYVPGTLQTADYARALFVGAEDRSAEKLRTSITVRMIRQSGSPRRSSHYGWTRLCPRPHCSTRSAAESHGRSAGAPGRESGGARWRKGSLSGENGNGAGCLEVAFLTSGDVALRDTKDRSRTPHVVSQRSWESFVAGIRAGEFGHPSR